MLSPAKLEANRKNALKSTGPKTPEGKTRSRRNAETHGLTSQPGEPTEAYRAALSEWVADLKPRGIAERTLVERACRAAWNLRRCDRYQDASAFYRDRDASSSREQAEADRVEAIGRRLLGWDDEEEVGDENPAMLVKELRRSAAGVSWLLARWTELGGEGLSKGWYAWQRSRAALLMGWRPGSAVDHPVLGAFEPRSEEIYWPPGGGKWDDYPGYRAALARFGETLKNRPGEGRELMDAWKRRAKAQGQPDLAEADRRPLAALVRRQVDALESLMPVLKDREEQDLAGAADRAQFDDPRPLALCLRYSGAASRDLHRAIRDLAKLREAGDGKDGDPTQTDMGLEHGSDAVSPSGGAAGGKDVAGCEDAGLRNEPTEAGSRSVHPAERSPAAPIQEAARRDDTRLRNKATDGSPPPIGDGAVQRGCGRSQATKTAVVAGSRLVSGHAPLAGCLEHEPEAQRLPVRLSRPGSDTNFRR